jgi:hypothetical protein
VQEIDGQEKLVQSRDSKLTGTPLSAMGGASAAVYVIETDGTGLVDCLFWMRKDAYTLRRTAFQRRNVIQTGILQVGGARPRSH